MPQSSKYEYAQQNDVSILILMYSLYNFLSAQLQFVTTLIICAFTSAKFSPVSWKRIETMLETISVAV